MTKGKDAKPHIGIFGRRNNGKSSIINALAGQEVAIVSDIAGTTTDPVKKSMEIFGIGPVILVDTAGIDDTGDLGEKRKDKTLQALKTVDAALLVIAQNAFGDEEQKLVEEFRKFEIPFAIVHNKSDIEPLYKEMSVFFSSYTSSPVIEFSAVKPEIEKMIRILKDIIPPSAYQTKSLIGDLINPGETVLLITPIDLAAPEGRMILPQVQLIRDILDNDCVAVVIKEHEVADYVKKMQPKPVLAVTDSQAFAKANAAIPPEIRLTSFSIVLARHKGDFPNYLKGTPYLNHLNDNDRILIMESCTHQVTCDDIGRVKLPNWLSKFSGKRLEFDIVSGLNKIPRDAKDYAMVIQCGGCMITRRQIINRLKPFVDAGIPVTNYGMAIAWIHGIYNRAVGPFLLK